MLTSNQVVIPPYSGSSPAWTPSKCTTDGHTIESFFADHEITLHTSLHEYIKSFISVKFIIVITQFRVSIATNCPSLTYCKNVIYAVDHERASSLLFQCIVSILRLRKIF
jgi:hypothetical protein